ncbi:MAG: 4Fe-4S binding protein [Candidatus Marinimicrobia bacterium]|nr:4Fe-4S binding protein [Candidatus Neomarinimicrobiota bacterium]MCF7840268.1 4Fe-4S binding protein [Candidatus Neomarinimicrobiota bacterium]MCF7903109.1 4Fe-4S binding protein [Candidatus Neomarinimicrobiota bacterium]
METAEIPKIKPRRIKPKIVRNERKGVQTWRFWIQTGFVALCFWIGVEFYLFLQYLDSGGATALVNRPPGVEGFLPISSLMSWFYFALTGTIHSAHPAGFFIFLAIVAISLLFGKTFCSWLCPIGFLSEMIAEVGEKVLGRRLKMPRWLDYPLRSLKYLLLAFFAVSIFTMSLAALKAFLDSEYNIVADIKMYHWFANLSGVGLGVIAFLLVASFFYRGFWCRYLCPYGALLGVTSLLSPNKIKRNPVSCIDCGLCAKACPSNIKVDKVQTVLSDECHTCMSCVDACPVADTLDLTLVGTKKRWQPRWVAIGIVVLFMSITGAAMVSGYWQNQVTMEQYQQLNKNLERFGHPGM